MANMMKVDVKRYIGDEGTFGSMDYARHQNMISGRDSDVISQASLTVK